MADVLAELDTLLAHETNTYVTAFRPMLVQVRDELIALQETLSALNTKTHAAELEERHSIRVSALEEAAQTCDRLADCETGPSQQAIAKCSVFIRALKDSAET